MGVTVERDAELRVAHLPLNNHHGLAGCDQPRSVGVSQVVPGDGLDSLGVQVRRPLARSTHRPRCVR
jgi:hypothetical protein